MGIMDRIRGIFSSSPGDLEQQADTELWSPQMGGDYKSFWDSMAKDKAGAYLAVAGEPFGEPATDESISAHGKDTAQILVSKMGIAKDDHVLEVGVGVGRIAEHIVPLCARFAGTDISANMIELAKKRLEGLGKVDLYASDKSDLSMFPDNTFDKVFFQVVLIHLDREDAFHYMREARRVLKPGGLAWFQFYNVLHPRGFREFEFAVDYMIEKGAKTRGRVHCYTADEVRQFVGRAGLVLDERASHLEDVDQSFNFDIPDTDWEFYLIALARKPEDG